MKEDRAGNRLYGVLPQVAFALRLTLAALAAVATAVALELEAPYWAAMTAVIVIQPTRGLLLEKSYFRLVGTAVGAAGGLLALLFSHSPLLITLFLSFWLAGCVGVGNLLYGLRSYAALVAGCTGAVVAMAGYQNPPHLYDLAFSRIACIVIGILVSTATTLLFTRRNPKSELLDRLVEVVAADFGWIAGIIGGGSSAEVQFRRQEILTELAGIEDSIDSVWAGSIDLRRRKRLVKNLVAAVLVQIEGGALAADHLLRQECRPGSWRERLGWELEQAVRRLHQYGPVSAVSNDLKAVIVELEVQVPLIGEAMVETMRCLEALVGEWEADTPAVERPALPRYIRHRDWADAGRAAMRAGAAIAAVGLAWALTGWTQGPLMLMAVSIMVSIFSTHDHPAVMLGHVFCGAFLGVAAAILCRLALLPGTTDPYVQELVGMPFLLAGGLALRHAATVRGAMDAILFFLFVMQLGVPGVAAPASFIIGGCACLGGIGVAIFCFRYFLPVNPSTRLRSLLLCLARDLAAMAWTDSPLIAERLRLRTHHRVLRLLVQGEKAGRSAGEVTEAALAALVLSRCLARRKRVGAAGRFPCERTEEAAAVLEAALLQPETILAALTGTNGAVGGPEEGATRIRGFCACTSMSAALNEC